MKMQLHSIEKTDSKIIGFDVYSCQNTDPERHEIRIEMGKIQK